MPGPRGWVPSVEEMRILEELPRRNDAERKQAERVEAHMRARFHPMFAEELFNRLGSPVVTSGVVERLRAYRSREPPSIYDVERLYIALRGFKKTGGIDAMEQNYEQVMGRLF